MKKQYFSPSFDLLIYAGKDVITASAPTTYSDIESGNGEWLNWSDMKK